MFFYRPMVPTVDDWDSIGQHDLWESDGKRIEMIRL